MGLLTRVTGSDVLQTHHNERMAPSVKATLRQKKNTNLWKSRKEDSVCFELSSQCIFSISDSNGGGSAWEYMNFMEARKRFTVCKDLFIVMSL